MTLWDNMEFKEAPQGSTEAAKHLVGSNQAGSQVWVKVIRKEDVLRSEWDLASDEFEIHRSVSGLPHVMPVLNSERDDELIAIAMPRADAGDLWQKIQYNGLTLSEGEAKRFASQLFHGLAALHRARIVHSDVKPHNILLVPQGDRLSIALCDFGLAKRLPSETGTKIIFSEIRGTQGYISPEVCAEQDYNEKIDVFSAAVVVFRLLAGTEPFYPVENFTEKVDFADDCCGHLSEECKDFLQSLLNLDPKQRLSAEEALQHAWMSNGLSEQEVETENELGLRFCHQRELEQVLEETTHVPREPVCTDEKPRKRHKDEILEVDALSFSSSEASTSCPEFESDDLEEDTMDDFWPLN
jgi:serine/threonine protein kinase